MSDKAAALLEEYAQGAKPVPAASSRQKAVEMLLERGRGVEPQSIAPVQQKPTTGQLMFDRMQADESAASGGDGAAGEVLLSMVSGVPASVAGGLRGLWHMINPSSSLDDAANAVQDTQQAMTYQPRTEAGRRGLEQIGAVGEWLGPKQGRFMGDLAIQLGLPPSAATVADLATQAGVAAVTGGAARAGLRKAGTGLEAVAAEREAMAARAGTNPQSMGAAEAAIDTSRLTPELRQVVESAVKEGPINRQFVERQVDADTLPIPMRLTKGQARQDPTLISNEQNLRGKSPDRAAFFQEQNRQLIDNLDEIRASAGPTVVHRDHVQNGQALIDSYKSYDEPIKADIRAKYKALEDANGGQFPVAGDSFVTAADAMLGKKMKGRYLPSQVRGDLDSLRETGSMTFEQFENLRTNLAAEARKAERTGDGNAAAAVNIVREALESLPIEGEAAAIKPLADAARAAAKARFDKLREDPAYRAAVEDGVDIGELSPEADAFVRKYVINGKSANIEKMRRNLSADPEAEQTITMAALNYLKDASRVRGQDGNFSQAGYNAALNHLSPRLKLLMPEEVGEQSAQLGRVAHYTQFQPRGSFVSNSNSAVALASEGLKSTLEGVANVKSGGIPVGTYVRKKLENRSAEKEWAEITAPGAGIKD